jgi:SAM-dependent methyltransferase
VPFDHNDHYHPLLLRQVPVGARHALDVGCGTGRFALHLAERGIAVDAVDSSADILDAARARSARSPAGRDVRLIQGDVTALTLPSGHYDFISAVASIHHMPLGVVASLRGALRPGGVLAILGLYRADTMQDHASNVVAIVPNAMARLAVAIRERGARAAGEAPSAEDRIQPAFRDATMTLAEIEAAAARLLPGYEISRLLFWRYLLVYRRDDASGSG